MVMRLLAVAVGVQRMLPSRGAHTAHRPSNLATAAPRGGCLHILMQTKTVDDPAADTGRMASLSTKLGRYSVRLKR